MKFLWLLFISISFPFIIKCKLNTPHIQIVSEKDTTNIGEIYVARIYIKEYNYQDTFPIFYIISDQLDTLPILPDYKEGCGIFRIKNTTPGEKEFQGFVEYQLDGKLDTLFFQKSYFVKDNND
jgi:hypothetical protein